jgi:YD repeat-containing protein
VILPSGRTYGFSYDPNGNLTSITMPRGVGHTKILNIPLMGEAGQG